MVITLRIFLIVCILIYLLIILNLLRKKNLNLRYTLVWLLSGVIMMVVCIFPDLLFEFARFIGVVDPVNMVFMVEGMFILIILLSLTTIASHINDKIRKLTQTIALLERRIRKLEEGQQAQDLQEEKKCP